ncbi:MAG: succinate dehydrogenase, cytochrome b subunit [Pseudomonadota bacterium]
MATGGEIRRDTGYRRNALWWAALVHRISGLALALFLPLHFLALGLAIEGEAALETFIRWSDTPAVKVAEAGLVFLLVAHLVGGLRVMVIETFAWRPGQKALATAGLAVAAISGGLFLIRVI